MGRKKTILTEDIKNKLRGVGVVSDTINYQVEIEGCPQEFSPNFLIKNMSVASINELKELLQNVDPSDETKLMETMDELCRKHIKNHEKLYDLSTGEELEFDKDENGIMTEKQYYSLPIGLRVKILNFLTSLSGLM